MPKLLQDTMVVIIDREEFARVGKRIYISAVHFVKSSHRNASKRPLSNIKSDLFFIQTQVRDEDRLCDFVGNYYFHVNIYAHTKTYLFIRTIPIYIYIRYKSQTTRTKNIFYSLFLLLSVASSCQNLFPVLYLLSNYT